MNFILFNPDEMRAESLGCYGQPLSQTPNIDRLAAQGTRFDQCHAQHTVCTPSRCSFMTGWYPHVRGHRTLWHLLRPEEPNLFKYLKQAGYDIHWWGKNDTLAQASFADSVSTIHHLPPRRRPPSPADPPHPNTPTGLDDPRYYSFLQGPDTQPIEEHADYQHVQGAIEFLRGRPTRPFVLNLNLELPHCPYTVPQPWYDAVNPADLPPLRPKDLPNRPDFHRLIRQYRRLDEAGEDTLRRIHAVYLGMISFIDHLLGRLLDVLDETGHADDTAVLFYSDHGDYAGDYGLVEKWTSGLEDVLTRVPMIVRAPASFGGKSGHVVHEQTELFDLFPTVMDLAGVQPRHTHFARSMVGQLRGEPGDPHRAVFADGGYDPSEPHCSEGRPDRLLFARDPKQVYYPKSLQQQEHPESIARCAMVRTSTHKLIHRPIGRSELYDLADDPQELNNVHDEPAYAAVRDELRLRLLDWYVHTSDAVPFDEDPRGLPTPGAAG